MKEKTKEKLALAVLIFFVLLIIKNFIFNAVSLDRMTFLSANNVEESEQPNVSLLPASDLVFPKDEGQHQNLKTEWWYFAGHLEDENNPGNKFGITLIFHKNSPRVVFNLADGVEQENFSALIPLEKYDVLGENNLTIVSGENYWLSSPGGGYKIHFKYAGKEINLNLTPQKPPFVSSLSGDTFYYQQTRLAVTGSLLFSPDKQYNVKGLGWVDHQGFKESLAWKTWRWYSLQLNNNVEITFVTDFYLKDGRGPIKNNLFIFKNEKKAIKSQDYEVRDLEYWINPKTNIRYPIKWRLEIPAQNTNLLISSLVRDQAIDEAAGFYEGTCLVSGIFEGKEVGGRAQFEYMPPVLAVD
jgi:predicted secreted hydrolase